MKIHLIAPKDQSKWLPVWSHCYNIWKSSPYKIKLWEDKDVDFLLQEDDKDFFNNYLNKLPSIYKWDYVRYIILEKFGGAYFDMDIEIIRDFIPMLSPNKMYLMEGTGGAYVENSIMITPEDLKFSPYWHRIKLFCKNKIINNINNASKENVIFYVGPQALSEFFIKHKPYRDVYDFDILAHQHFASLYNSLSFSRHYQTSVWDKPI